MIRSSVPPEANNYLLFSDVHLGADLVQHARPWTAKRLHAAHRIDHDLGTMLDHYREHADPLRPWRLVIAGDFIDLVGMSISLSEGSSLSTPLDEDEVVHGLGSAEDRAAFKMRAVAMRHDRLFRTLARFVAAGHSLVFVRGNHDVEFYWASAQRAFLEALLERVELPQDSASDASAIKAAFEARVEFRHWFYYVRGLLYVEHGHQYDATCAYHHVLAPRSPRDPRRINYSFSDILLRYVVHPTRELSSDGHENNSLFHYLRLAFSLGVQGCAMLAYRFFSALGRMVSAWRDQLSEHTAQIKAEHEHELQKLASVFRLSTEHVRAMTQLWATPVTTHLLSIFRTVFLDGLAVGIAAGSVLGVLALCGVVPWSWFVPLMFAVALAMFIYAKSRRVLEPHAALRRGASKLAALMPARYFVMGHTHKAVMEALTPTSTYVNLGNWTGDLFDESGPPAPCTHLVIRHGEGGTTAAELCRWHDGHAARVSASDPSASDASSGLADAAVRAPAASAPAAAPPIVS
jgi:UDP-2,3-diacylglucosamine pyrophosphatase LpxH